MSSNSVCNHTCDKHTCDFVITRMITDRIGLYSILLLLLMYPFNFAKSNTFIDSEEKNLIAQMVK